MKKLFLLSILALLTSFLNAQTYWTPVDPEGSTGLTATIIGVVQFEGEEQYSNQLEVGVFDGDVCRGTGMTSTVYSDRYLVFLSVFGIEGDEYTFKIYDHATSSELDMSCNQTFVYHDQGQTGTIPSPCVLEFLFNHYVINVSADPTDGGTVTGSGTYDRDAPVSLNATANDGYTFSKWTKNDVQVSTSATYDFNATMSTAGDYVAHFTLNSYDITVEANPTEGGTVSGGGTYTHGQEATLTATPATGYHFVNWTKAGSQVSTEASYTFTVTADGDYVANFAINSYTITVTADPTAGGTVSGDGTYNHGTTATLTAEANEGYTFTKWTKADTQVSTDANYSFTVTEGGDYIGVFMLNSYTITVAANPTEGGTVSGGGTYNHGQEVTLVATPAEGYTFTNWTKDGSPVSTEATYVFSANAGGNYVANFALNSYEITVEANPTAGGTVGGGGTFTHGQEATLTATPADGYHFVNWTKGGTTVSTNATYTFTVTAAGNYVANFALNSYEITVVANPTDGGTVSGGGTYTHGQEATLTAAPADGYHFVNWTKDGAVVFANATYSFTVEGAGNYVANFSLNSYTITATADPISGGTITGTGTYNYGETCTLTAESNTGCTFVNWTKDGVEVSTETSISFTVMANADYVAHFNLIGYEISATADPAEGGTVTGAGGYNYGETCTLTATANTGYTFTRWTKNGSQVSTNATYSFTVTGAAAYVANFSLDSYEINVSANPPAGGTVDGAGTYNHGETVTLTATAATGYHFVNWTKGGAEVSTDATYSFVVTEAGDYVANFEQNSYTITVAANPTEGGDVNGAGTFTHGETATLTATAATGYTFVNWTKEDNQVSPNATYSFEVTSDGDYVANFTLKSYEITVSANPTEGGTVTGEGTYTHGQTATLTATAATGYHFVRWTKGGAEVSIDANYSFEVTEGGAYVANFELNSYVISATANPTEGGTVTGGGNFNHFDNCTLTAAPSTGYHFVNWTLNGEEISTSATYSFEVTGAASFVANFELNSYTITATSDPVSGGTITGAGTYNHFETCTLTATANIGCSFVNWTKDGVEVSTDISYSFTVEGEAAYVAHFILNGYEVSAIANPIEGGTITGMGGYEYGQTATLTATANTGYTFLNWTLDGTVVSTSATYSFEVTGAVSFVANFELNSYVITATADPSVGGTVTGAGTFHYGETATLTATANMGYTFTNWTKDGTIVSTDATYSFTVEGTGAYVANFILNSYEITATANPAAAGTIIGVGTYNYGTTVTLIATANTGYTFLNWTKDGTVVSTSATYNFEVTEAASFVANFELNSYVITATANPAVGGTVAGAGTYNYGATATLTATANTGYTFTNWTKNGTVVSTNATYSFTVEGTGAYVANFELNSYEITATANPSAAGTIIGVGTYNYGTTVTLIATANPGYTFLNWTMDGTVVSTSTTYSFEVTGAASFVANFELNSYEITATANPAIGGTVAGAGTYYYGATATLTATPADDYVFVNWTKSGVEVSTSPTYAFTVTEAGDYVANFSIGYVDIVAYASQPDFGTVTGGGSYPIGSICTLTATPNDGFVFVKWAKGTQVVSTEAVYSFEVTESGSYRALFEREPYYITAEVNPADAGTVSGADGTFYNNTTCQLIATANEGYNFLNWTKDGAVVSTNYIYEFAVTGSAHFVANFELINPVPETVEITAEVDPAAGGTVTGAGTYEIGETVTMSAVANMDYRFVNWTLGGEVVTDAASFSFIATEDMHFVAHFISTVGVNDVEELPISVYPNPTVDKLLVESPLPIRQCEVYSITGQCLLQFKECGQMFEVQLPGLPSGSYLLRLTSDDHVEVREFIKK